MKSISPSSFLFLKDLKKNNNREWFTKHKDRYLKEHALIIAFADEVLASLRKYDNIETPSGKSSLYRIYRDSRFSKDKTPYKTHWSGGFRRATKWLRGGYYFHIEQGNSFVAGGFFSPNPDDLKRIREDIELNHEEWRKIFKNKTFKSTFGALQGEALKTAPKGFDKDHPAIDLLRHKQFIIKHSFTDKEVMAANFAGELVKTLRAMRPYFDYMSYVLTTDANGEALG